MSLENQGTNLKQNRDEGKPVSAPRHSQVPENTTYSKIKQLEQDLKYVTGKSNREEVQKRLKELRDLFELEISSVKKANEENYEYGMSFNLTQREVVGSEAGLSILDFLTQNSKKGDISYTLRGLPDTEQIFGINRKEFIDVANNNDFIGDIGIKRCLDKFVKWYRENRKDFPVMGYRNNYNELDKFVLDYEKAFGQNNGTLITEDKEKTKELRVKEIKDKMRQVTKTMGELQDSWREYKPVLQMGKTGKQQIVDQGKLYELYNLLVGLGFNVEDLK